MPPLHRTQRRSWKGEIFFPFFFSFSTPAASFQAGEKFPQAFLPLLFAILSYIRLTQRASSAEENKDQTGLMKLPNTLSPERERRGWREALATSWASVEAVLVFLSSTVTMVPLRVRGLRLMKKEQNRFLENFFWRCWLQLELAWAKNVDAGGVAQWWERPK